MPPKVMKGSMKRPAAKKAAPMKPAKRKKSEDEGELEDTPNKVQFFSKVDIRSLTKWGAVVLQDATYYGRTAPVAGFFQTLSSEGDNVFIHMKVTGTKHEELLRVLSGRRTKTVQIHLCGDDCQGQLTDEVLLHARSFKPTELNKVPWLTNLQTQQELEGEVDEMEALRLEQQKMEAQEKEKRRKEERKEKKQRRKKGLEEGRRSKSPKEDAEGYEVGQKSLEAVFRNTGMDPDPSRRAKILKRARKLGKKGKKRKKRKDQDTSSSRSSSSSSSSGSSEADYGAEGLFDDEKRLRSIWKRCPGALAARSIQEVKKNLVTSAGTVWEVNKASLPPLFTQYGRQVVMPHMSASLQQESLTVCQSLDLLAQGHIAACMDVLTQRLKSLEALGRGAHWSFCRQHELLRVEEGGMAEDQEKIAAAKRAREEERLRSLMTRPQGAKGGETSQGGKARKGKEGKGAYKGQSGDGGRGKGGQGGKEDNKPPWPKKNEK
eukprot:s1973_g6.t1